MYGGSHGVRDEEDIRHDSMAAESASRLASVIGDERRFVAGDALPLLWHWAYFSEFVGPHEVGRDGHPVRQDGLVEQYPRRMAGGSRVEEIAPFRLGIPATRRSRLENLAERDGRSGSLAIAHYVHTYTQEGRDVRREMQTVIYRGPSASDARTRERADGVVAREACAERRVGPTLSFDPVVLFRFSAVTWNAHRIHYDREYATGTEGYPGLVVHGPLLAVLLASEVERTAGSITRLDYRALVPVFDSDVVAMKLRQEGALWTAEIVKQGGVVATSLSGEVAGGRE
jgi:hydroxyacyl-ACP dehydratase HTD2-like protein with hotdog domain